MGTSNKSVISPIHYEDDLESTLGDDTDDDISINSNHRISRKESMDGIDGMDDVSDSKSNGGSSALVYESADEKLSEWDLDVSLMGSLSDTSKLSEGVIDTQTKRTSSIPITTVKTLKSETRGLGQESMS